jgi:hypothetical protein
MYYVISNDISVLIVTLELTEVYVAVIIKVKFLHNIPEVLKVCVLFLIVIISHLVYLLYVLVFFSCLLRRYSAKKNTVLASYVIRCAVRE